jgi:hypothetical protein
LSKNSGDCDLFIRQTPSAMAFDSLSPHKNQNCFKNRTSFS